MKKLIIYISLALFFCNCTTDRNVIKQYRTAYDYLLKLSDIPKDGLKVSDTIVFIELCNFYIELSDGNGMKMLFMLDSLDRERHFENYVFTELRNLPSNQLSRYNLFFSEFIDNLLLAEILESNNTSKTTYKQLVAFNQSMLYLFVFDKNKQKINNVYSKKIQYD